MHPKFSIIIPVYNVAPWLRACLDSVLAQAWCDWECICVNDGSTDESGTILEEYEKKVEDEGGLRRFKVIHQKNAGVSAARNAALEVATGEWVMMLDGDDTWDENLLVKLYDEIKAHPDCDAVGFGLVKVNEKGERVGEVGKVNVPPAVMIGDDVLLDGRGPYSKFIWSSCDKIYRRLVIERYHLRYVVGMRHSEDSLFSQLFLAYAGKIVLRPDILGYRYLMREGSAIHSRAEKLPNHPFGVFEVLYYHWQRLRKPGLQKRLYYTAVGAPSLCKGDGYNPSVRLKAIDLLLASEVFNRQILPFSFRYGGLKARLFVGIYFLSPSCLRRKLLNCI